MPVRSILDIDLRDEKFLRFKKIFDQYQASVAKLPSQWRGVTQAAGAAEDEFKGMVGLVGAIAAATKALEKSESNIERIQQRRMTVGQRLLSGIGDEVKKSTALLGGAEIKWAALDRITMGVARNVKEATGWLLKWGSLTGVISGLAGIGGLFGLDRLAVGAASARQNSFQTGAPTGAIQAFDTNFSRLVDTQGFLSGIASSKTDITRRVGLTGAGLSAGDIAGDTVETGVALLKRLKKIADTTDPALYEQTLSANRINSVVPVNGQTLLGLRNTSQREFAGLLSRFSRNQKDFAVPNDVQERWQDFDTTLKTAGRNIDNTFIRGLDPITGGLGHLSESVQKVIRAFLESPNLKKWLTSIDQGLEKFAGYIGTDKFAQDVHGFVDGLGNLVSAVGSAAKWFTGLFGDDGAGKDGDEYDTRGKSRAATATQDQMRKERAAGTTSVGSQFLSAFTSGRPMTEDALLEIIRKRENSGPNDVSIPGAIGRYQIMPKTGAGYGYSRDDLFDPKKNEEVARKLVHDLVKQYHGNTDQVLVGYNGGTVRANAFRKHGDDLGYTMPETQKYVGAARGMPGYAPKVEITIDPSVGANVNSSVNGLKQ